MKLLLYAIDPPHGRCLLLAQKLHQVTGVTASDCLQIAARLFAGHHPRDNPVSLNVAETRLVDDLEATCTGLGVVIEIRSGKGDIPNT